MNITIGDLVAIRGDKYPPNLDGRCPYTEEQLIMGKYLKHTGHGGIWTGRVEKIKREEGIACVGGIWRSVDLYEIMQIKA